MKAKEFLTMEDAKMEDAKSDKGDIAPIRRSRRGRGAPKDMQGIAFPSVRRFSLGLTSFTAYLVYVKGDLEFTFLSTYVLNFPLTYVAHPRRPITRVSLPTHNFTLLHFTTTHPSKLQFYVPMVTRHYFRVAVGGLSFF